jgi:hypothetical protein
VKKMSVIPNRSVRNLHQMTLLFEFRFLWLRQPALPK